MALSRAELMARWRVVREWLQQRWRAFRAKNRYFQARSFIVSGYVVVSLLTTFLAPPAPARFLVQAKQIPWGVSYKNFVEVTNLHLGDIDNAAVEIEGFYTEFDGRRVTGMWRSPVQRLPEGEKLKIFPEDLRDKKGGMPVITLVFERVRLLDANNDDKVLVDAAPTKSK